jgi:Collagen triple helix repeat (20 copies)
VFVSTVVAALAVAGGCSSGKPLDMPTAGASGTAGTTGAGGAPGPAGATGAAGASGTAGATGTAGVAGAAGATGTAGASGTAGVTGTAGAAGTAGVTGTAGGAAGAGGASLTGCGREPDQPLGMAVMHTIQTKGTKAADCADTQCGAWSFARDYWLKLPTSYDKNKKLPLIFEGPGCGGHGNNVFTISALDATVIRVGLSPSADAQAFHATNPGQGCFDDSEGDDSVDWPFYEALYDELSRTVCFDKDRVFAAGNSDGATFANELGCKYAGDVTRPIRGVMADSGWLPTDSKFEPTCTTKPMAGIWIHVVGDGTYPFTGTIAAINRAMAVDHCTIGTNFDTAMFDNFSITGRADATCRRIKGCPEATPLVVCELPGQRPDNSLPIPAWPAFLQLFQ